MGSRGSSSSSTKRESAPSYTLETISKLSARKRDTEIRKMETALIGKYSDKQINDMRNKYEEAKDMYILGGDVEDKKGLKVANKMFYNEADSIMKKIPKDYKNYREIVDEYYW